MESDTARDTSVTASGGASGMGCPCSHGSHARSASTNSTIWLRSAVRPTACCRSWSHGGSRSSSSSDALSEARSSACRASHAAAFSSALASFFERRSNRRSASKQSPA
eukprot:scaffold308760_cov28-Tisochrysis_lutea.AAC.1